MHIKKVNLDFVPCCYFSKTPLKQMSNKHHSEAQESTRRLKINYQAVKKNIIILTTCLGTHKPARVSDCLNGSYAGYKRVHVFITN